MDPSPQDLGCDAPMKLDGEGFVVEVQFTRSVIVLWVTVRNR